MCDLKVFSALCYPFLVKSVTEGMLFQEALADPFEAVPAADEDEAADVFIEGEDEPHRYEAPAQRDAEKVTSDHLYAPHDDDAKDYREIDVSCASEGIYAKEIECSSVFKEYLYPEYCNAR